MTIPLIILGVIALIAFLVASLYNNLVRLRNSVRNAFAQVDVQLKKRYDLIPNLVATVKQYMEHERELLENITALRSRAIQPGLTQEQKMNLDQQVSQKLMQLQVQVENYPNLKANENFLNLQHSLAGIEQEIAMARNYYNSTVTTYNTQIQVFPNVLLAGLLGFTPEPLYQAQDMERENVDVGQMFERPLPPQPNPGAPIDIPSNTFPPDSDHK